VRDAPDDDVEQPLDALCAQHPERRASIVCPHCGSFACGQCTVDTLWGDVMCESCQRHGRAQYPVPWEQGPSLVTFLHSAYLVFADTGSLFGAFPSGSLRRAASFALCVAASTALLDVTLQQLFVAPRNWAEQSPGISLASLAALVADLADSALLIGLGATLFHGAALLLGGRGRYPTALRACCYAFAVDLLGAAGRAADKVLSGSTLVLVFGMVAAFFVCWALSLVGEHRYGLTKGRAVVAAVVPFAAYIALVMAAALIETSGWFPLHR